MSHYNVQPVIDIYGSVQGRDLGSVARDMQPILDRSKASLPRGSELIVRGQIQTMNASFVGLLFGLVFSIALVYLLIVVNFQSWLDPFIILRLSRQRWRGSCGCCSSRRRPLSVPALTGAIMCMGVATANSILLVSFAREQFEILVGDARRAALNAGFVRLRPVLMTALAMILGMAPIRHIPLPAVQRPPRGTVHRLTDRRPPLPVTIAGNNPASLGSRPANGAPGLAGLNVVRPRAGALRALHVDPAAARR